MADATRQKLMDEFALRSLAAAIDQTPAVDLVQMAESETRPNPSSILMSGHPDASLLGCNPSLKTLFSSATDEWPTPQWLFDALRAEFPLHARSVHHQSNAKCARYFTRMEDGFGPELE